MKTHIIPSELLFEDAAANIRLDVAEVPYMMELAPLNGGAMGVLLMNGTPAAVFQDPRLARSFGMQMETFRELAALRDAVFAVTHGADAEGIVEALRALDGRARKANEFLEKASKVAAGEVPGRVTQ